MKKFFKDYFTVLAIGTAVVLICFAIMLPDIMNKDGQCFYYNSGTTTKELTDGKLIFFKVVDNDLYRYIVLYFSAQVDKKTQEVKVLKNLREGTLPYSSLDNSYTKFKCPLPFEKLEM